MVSHVYDLAKLLQPRSRSTIDLPPETDISTMEPHHIAASAPGGKAWAALGTRDFLRMAKQGDATDIEWVLTETPGTTGRGARGVGDAQRGAKEVGGGIPLRYERPDDRTILATLPEDPGVRVKVVLDQPIHDTRPGEGGLQRVEVPEIYRGGLGPGSGSALLAKVLRDHGVIPSQLVFRSVEHEGTLVVLLRDGDPATTVLGRSGARTLEQLGLRVDGYRTESDKRGGLDLVIEVMLPGSAAPVDA